MEEFIQQLFNGLHVGSIYALIALGYTMVYGIVKLINFAHGEILMIGAYSAYFLINSGMPIWLTILLSMLICAIIGVIIEKLAYKPLRNAPRISALITAIAVSILLQNLFMILFKPDGRPFPEIIKLSPIHIGSVKIEGLTILSIVVSFILMVGLHFFIKNTKTGKAMRAVSQDQNAAMLMGIDINKTISATFAIGSALAAVGGILFSIAYPLIEPYMGMMPGLKAFIAAVLGGIGIIPGAMVGGVIMGVAESFTRAYISSQLSDAVVFGILIVVLIVKPTGLFGKNTREKV
ncbi:high-affinity branched-chain amino acid ABC transporter system permease protein LivH [Gottschalkia acidurici 9a]|uniref:High-affinity branched-chain amino acid ABC transporter system permease protein LivH n=1 Tax=Gottschalkia acidurici (strain ATCC 7906 / DSM 604 / BCRC 14475 / CIP 104303 / KCTC 5404 / NCIMB 10678 / 9a) TaxID=1128398 RepID=K0B0L4_GOTA9|nr:branched-chain amino acid ABC transporter permease [Gottschalkia acidurici]AFS78186.1 high-affinity branched-chain amino acid ABC transporter system permease protein LivH [Gottschalkia acidurici 9a]